jgi:hypothetical protein
MTKSEKILTCSALLAVLLKVLSIPGGGLLAVISFMLLSILYFPLGFATLNNIGLRRLFNKESYSGISLWRMIGTIGLGMSFSGIVSGTLFKIQHYPGAQISLISGIVISFIIGVIILVRYMDTKSSFYKNTLIKIVVLCVIGAAMLFNLFYHSPSTIG